MNPRMYIFLNEGVGMTGPKMAAQAAHAAVEAYREQSMSASRKDTELLEEWYIGGHYTKIILAARDEQHLINIRSYLGARGFDSVLIIDEGRTEVAPHTATALGCWVVDKDDPHTAATFGDFKLLKESKPERPIAPGFTTTPIPCDITPSEPIDYTKYRNLFARDKEFPFCFACFDQEGGCRFCDTVNPNT